MPLLHHILTLLPLTCLTPVLADYLGPRYPPPAALTGEDSVVAAGWENLASTLQARLGSTGNGNQITTSSSSSQGSDGLSAIQNLSFSLGMFSIHDDAAAGSFQYHHTSHEVANGPFGAKEVDGDTIYRILSISKLFTVYAALLNLKSTDWERPLTDFFPQLAKPAGEAANDPVKHVQWDKVTPIALAAQVAGVPRDSMPAAPAELTFMDSGDLVALGFPPLDRSRDPVWSSIPCVDPTDLNCGENTDNLVGGLQERPPTFLPWTTPGYANSGFLLLGRVLEHITGKTTDDIYRDSIFEPLNMTNSGSNPPPESEWSRAVIPGEDPTLFTINVAKPTGGLLATTNDLAKLGISILNNTLLPAHVTRKWMKPHSHTARLTASVGAPWEIVRYTHPDSGVVTDIYTKSGDFGLYTAWLVLVPDFGIGFSILTASTSSERAATAAALADLMIDTLLPAMTEQAAAEAERNFGGSYQSSLDGLNSSLTLSLNKTEGASPGLAISSFVSNGTDMLLALPEILGGRPTRLVPSVVDAASGQVAFRAIAEQDRPRANGGGWISAHMTTDWGRPGAVTYGSLDTDLFVFDVDADGRAEAASPVAYRVKLERTDDRGAG